MSQDLTKYRNISIHQILGLRHRRRASITCQFPGHNDSTPSLCIYPDNSYYCFGCGISGQNALDFALHVNGAVDLKRVKPDEFRKALTDLEDYL